MSQEYRNLLANKIEELGREAQVHNEQESAALLFAVAGSIHAEQHRDLLQLITPWLRSMANTLAASRN